VAGDGAVEVVEETQELETLPQKGAEVHRSARGRLVPRKGFGMGEAKKLAGLSSLLVAAVAEMMAGAVEHRVAEERTRAGLDRTPVVPVVESKPVHMLPLELEMQP
jgi:hypothetical protein